MADALNLRRVYAEIIRGYSTESWGGAPLYIKHLCHFDQVDIDLYYEEELAHSKDRGIPTEAANLKWLEAQGLWVRKDESALSMQKGYVENLHKTKAKLFIGAQIADMQRQIDEGTLQYFKDLQRKINLIGMTCEKAAERKLQFYYVHLSCYLDRDLTQRAFSREQLNQLDEDDSNSIMDMYIRSSNRFDTAALRKIAVSPYFTNYFYICGDAIASFFNRPIAELSIHQVNLLSYGLYYKRILTNHQVPDDIRDNPDRLEEYVTKTANLKNVTDKTAGQGNRVGIVGASAADFEAMGVKDGSDTMRAAANKQYTSAMDAARDMGIDFKD